MSNEDVERPEEPVTGVPPVDRRREDEAERIRSSNVREPVDLERGAGGYPERVEADRIRSDGIVEPADVPRGVVGDKGLTEAERIRADGIEEPLDADVGVVGDSAARTEADRIRSADLTDDPVDVAADAADATGHGERWTGGADRAVDPVDPVDPRDDRAV
ncbi:hypothetical protein [Cellulomonas alba]|uniref:DUF5709 domain-containing protein n=1 Tax=Cellulomonas alba TaxID=3053467 RepID=A0ABT7SEX8_9CELL|nr:hypothetical protein [Cellulomonas alba]MDM7854730.1 hypothetical protein [Cellulomonas alba]